MVSATARAASPVIHTCLPSYFPPATLRHSFVITAVVCAVFNCA